jgi:hypothetical protein
MWLAAGEKDLDDAMWIHPHSAKLNAGAYVVEGKYGVLCP